MKYGRCGLSGRWIYSALTIVLLCCAAFMHGAATAQSTSADAGPQRAREIQVASAAFSRGVPQPQWAAPLPGQPGEPAFDGTAILYADTHFRVEREPVTFVARVFQTYQAAALAELGQYAIEFQPDYQRLQLHALHVVRGTERIDKTASADIRFLMREQSLDSGVLTGTVSAVILVDDLRIGDVLEISYSIIGQNPVYGEKFVGGTGWDGAVPIRFRRVTLDTAGNRDIQYRFIGNTREPEPEPAESRSGGRRILSFEAKNLPAVEVENFLPRDIQPRRWIQFSEFASWAEVARWASSLLSFSGSVTDLDPALTTTGGATNPHDAIIKSLGFVQDEIRYLSIALGENSHKPYPPSEVLKRRYGDCKDKSVLLAAMLRRLGIDATPVLVSLQFHKGLDRMLPSPLVFDHVIVRVTTGNRSYFLDPTLSAQGRDLDRLGQVHAGAQFLLASPETSDLDAVPGVAAESSISSRTERIQVSEIDGPAELQIRLEYEGIDAESVRRMLGKMSREQIRKMHEGLFDRRYSGAVLKSGPDISDSRDANRYVMEATFTMPRALEAVNNGWVARFQADNLLRLFYLPESAKRQHAVGIPGYPSISRYEFELTLPAAFNANRRPAQQTVEGRGFTVQETSSFTGRVLRLSQEARITADRIEPQDVPQFLEDLRKAERLFGGGLVILRSDMQPFAGPALSLKASVTQRLEQLVQSTTSTIENFRRQGRPADATLCERARALSYLQRRDEAISDIQEALRNQPGSADLLKCSGEIRFTLGDFVRSVADLSRAYALKPDDSEVLFYRGLSNYYLGRPGDAAQDFAKSGKYGQDAVDRIRTDIWQTLALRKMPGGKPHSVARPGDDPAPWPAPAFELFNDRRTTDDVLREAHRQPGDRLDAALAEAYLYVGQYLLLQGDPVRAGVFFNRAKDKGSLHSFFNAAAMHESARLRNP